MMTSAPKSPPAVPTAELGGVILRDLTKRYGSFTAVEGLNLTIQPGSYTCLLGPSGCGKTTTLRMIAGHEEISSGEIWIGDRRINGIPAAQRDTAMVFQNYALFPHKTVWENISFGLKMKQVPKPEQQRRTAEMLALVDLEEFAKRKPAQLSGGQQQRVALARALVTRPQVVLLDEPLSALDESLRVRTRLELRKLQKQFGLTFVQVTHAQDEAFALSDQVVVMDRGRIDQVGTPSEVFNRPASQFVARFVGDNNILQGKVVNVVYRNGVYRDPLPFVNGFGGASSKGQPQAKQAEIELDIPGMGAVFCRGQNANVGQVAACSVRGDRLQIVSPPASHSSPLVNRIEARITAIEFTGFVSRITLLSLGEKPREFLLKIQTDQWIQSGCEAGQIVQLGWSIEDSVFLSH